MDKLSQEEHALLRFLDAYVTDHKKMEIDRVLGGRTRRLTIVLENIYQAQNASAALRTCECYGVQDVHIIENTARYAVNPGVLKGANKWLTLHRYRDRDKANTQRCFDALRGKGYYIVSLDPGTDGRSLFDMEPVNQKVAFVFGNELKGLSVEALNGADERRFVPMTGFTESLNISATVSATLTWAIATWKKLIGNEAFALTQDEKDRLRLEWYRKILKRSDDLERAYKKRMKTNQ